MAQTGVDLLLDIHGDEEIPYNFIMPAKNSCQITAQGEQFKLNFMKATKEFQIEVDYDTSHKNHKLLWYKLWW
jgi:hypothetical protein